MIENGDHVVAGVSGGADSVCLLRVLCELRECMGFSLSAVHVEHGIRGAESLSDAAFVRELCAALEVPLLSFSVDAPGRAGARHQSLEEAARDLRYESFYAACRQLGANVWRWPITEMIVRRRCISSEQGNRHPGTVWYRAGA